MEIGICKMCIRDRPEPSTPAAPVEEISTAPVQAVEKTPEQPAPAMEQADLGEDEVAARIEEFLTGLLAHMGAEAAPRIALDERGNYQVELVGQNLGSLIGRRGETLDAIQQLTVCLLYTSGSCPGRIRRR